MQGTQFIGRLLQHVLPPGSKRIRHYGLLAMPTANPQAREDAQAFMRRVAAMEIESCPHCRLGRWCVVEDAPADRAPLAMLTPTECRGPPRRARD